MIKMYRNTLRVIKKRKGFTKIIISNDKEKLYLIQKKGNELNLVYQKKGLQK